MAGPVARGKKLLPEEHQLPWLPTGRERLNFSASSRVSSTPCDHCKVMADMLSWDKKSWGKGQGTAVQN